MAMKREAAVALAKSSWPAFLRQRRHAESLDKWVRGNPPLPTLPKTATPEYKELQARSTTPWMGLVVSSVSQALFVEGHRSPRSADNSPLWDAVWQKNGLDARQIAVHRSALSHGISYVFGRIGIDPMTGARGVALRGKSARRMIAFYREDGEDEWPEYALEAERQVSTDADGNDEVEWLVWLHDEDTTHILRCDDSEDGDGMTFIDSEPHGSAVCPVVRFTNMIDLDGNTEGEVAPFIPLASRIDQDTFDRLVVQRFGAWKVRWIAGMQKPETDEERRAAALALRIEDLLVSGDAATKFGTLDATDLAGYISARDADIRDLAAATQTPPHHLLGLSPNLSAEALAAAEASLMRKVQERKTNFGESWEQALRLGGYLLGDMASAADFTSSVRWRDIESRSLAQVADALGKIAASLHVPVQMLWERLPGWTDDDTEEAMKLLREAGAEDALFAELLKDQLEAEGGIGGGNNAGGAPDGGPSAGTGA